MKSKKTKRTGESMIYDPTVKYQRDYMSLFRDRFGIPEERLHIITEGPAEGCLIDGLWVPKRSRLFIDLEHDGFISVIYLGDWEIWRTDLDKWLLYRWYGGTVMLHDGSGPYELQDLPIGKFIKRVRRLLEIDQERALAYDDIRSIIKTTSSPGPINRDGMEGEGPKISSRT